MLHRTGETTVARGVYHSTCKCRREITVRSSDRFPKCPVCHRAVGWMFARSVMLDAPAPPRPDETKP